MGDPRTPKIDRIACPWLIARFIDREPEFLFVPPVDVLATARDSNAIPYDVPDVELTHSVSSAVSMPFCASTDSTTRRSPNSRHCARRRHTGRPELRHKRRDCSRFRWGFLTTIATTTRC